MAKAVPEGSRYTTGGKSVHAGGESVHVGGNDPWRRQGLRKVHEPAQLFAPGRQHGPDCLRPGCHLYHIWLYIHDRVVAGCERHQMRHTL